MFLFFYSNVTWATKQMCLITQKSKKKYRTKVIQNLFEARPNIWQLKFCKTAKVSIVIFKIENALLDRLAKSKKIILTLFAKKKLSNHF